MVYLKWAVRLLVFIVLMGFSIRNLNPVTVHFFLNYQFQEPLVLVLLVFTVVGALLGLLASLATLWRLRREINALKKQLRNQVAETSPGASTPDRGGNNPPGPVEVV